MLQLFLIPAIIVILVSFNALYVAAEFSTVAARKTRIKQMGDDGNAIARILYDIMDDPQGLDRYVATCQIGITISSLLLGMYGQDVIAGLLIEPLSFLSENVSFITAETVAAIVVLVFITALQVILGELLPKSISIQYPERVALALTIPMRISLTVLGPLIWFFNGSGNLLLKLMGREHKDGHGHVHSAQEIELLVQESHEEGLLDDEEKQMLRNAFRMRDLVAKQVMIHRTRIIAAPIDSSVEDLLRLAADTGKSRIPLYEEDIDRITSFIHIKDLFRCYTEKTTDLTAITRKVVHVPEALPISEVWEKLRGAGQYFAIVFDEFGGTAGIITLEDLIEEIFGELQDESDDEVALLYIGKQGRLRFRWD